MKSSIFTTIALCSLLMVSKAQTEEVVSSRDAKKRVVPGLKIGFNRSNVWDAKGEDFVADTRTGYALGGYVAIPLGSLLGIQPELMLQEKGFKGSGNIAGTDYSVSRRTTHLDIPIQLMVKPVKWFTFLIGPQYSFLLQQTDALNVAGNSQLTEQEMKDVNFRKNLFGTIAGFDLNFKKIVLSGRWGWDVSDNHGDGTSSAPRYRNRWTQWTIGYRFY